MKHHISDIEAQIKSLLPISGPDWDCGPFTEEEILRVEKRIGRSLEPDHREMLLLVGGCFTFRTSVYVADGEHRVSSFMGTDPQHYSIDGIWYGYRGQIPETWYPFANDSQNHLYCISGDNGVYYVFLEEKYWATRERPETSGERIADSFYEFVMSLSVPDWTQELTPDPAALYDVRGQRVPRNKRHPEG